MEERYHPIKQSRLYPNMSNVNKNITMEANLISPPTYTRVLYGSENKQRLFPYTASTDWFFYNREGMCLLRGTTCVFKFAEAVSRQPDFESQVSPCAIYGGQSGTETGFPPSSYVSPASIIPPMLHTYLYLRAGLTRTANRTFETSKKECSFGNREALDRNILPLFRP
jgi:hypothetical protein